MESGGWRGGVVGGQGAYSGPRVRRHDLQDEGAFMDFMAAGLGMTDGMSRRPREHMERIIASPDCDRGRAMRMLEKFDVKSEEREHFGPLHDAASKGEMDTCKHLVEHLGFDINSVATDGSGMTPLACAVSHGKAIAARYFLDKGGDIDKQDCIGFAPLHYAAKKGNVGMAYLLVSRGACVDVLSSEGTPLHVAASYGKYGVMQVLLEGHADDTISSEDTKDQLKLLGREAVAEMNYAGASKFCTKLNKHLLFITWLILILIVTPTGAAHLVESRTCDHQSLAGEINGNCLNQHLPGAYCCNAIVSVVERGSPTPCFCYVIRDDTGITAEMIIRFYYSCRGKHPAAYRLKELCKDHNSTTSMTGSTPANGKNSTSLTLSDGAATKMSSHHFSTTVIVIIVLLASFIIGGTVCIIVIYCKRQQTFQKLDPESHELITLKDKKAQLNLLGEDAITGMDYDGASKFFTEAIELDPADATLYSNRSFCLLKIGEDGDALHDANDCIRLRPEWSKGYYRKGAALVSLQNYKEACDAFMDGLRLDPANVELRNAYWEASEAMRNEHSA